MTWELLWKISFVIVLSLFAIMAIITTIGGARDIRRLLSHLRHPEDDEPESD